jgi:hypothetical protein
LVGPPEKGADVDTWLLLVKAQEADAFAHASQSPIARRAWENLAEQYRQLAEEIVDRRPISYGTQAPDRTGTLSGVGRHIGH